MREKKEINIQIGNEIRKARERAGLTQEQLGELVSLGTKNIKRVCEKLSLSADILIFGDRDMDDVTYIAERLKRLPPEQFKAVEAFINQIFLLFGQMEN